ncbi:hypothetical protein R1sor_001484 [Riccia sorocarpa]|uniref:Helicase C-terminal domain-containing protein n=1 Tax=Riccia sorocarpa TaxID=122646 RepID=A0ABD3GW33_9MARC
MRPVKLTSKVFDIILQYCNEKPTLVFCPTRKGAQDTALKLAETVSKAGAKNPFIKTEEQRVRLQAAGAETNDKNMQSCIPFGVGFHSGGVGFADRGLVEGLFLKGDLPVLCTTMTLAHGMNLPAHLVVIKSTQS